MLVVGTSPGMVGAGCLAADAALRSGAGLVTLATPRSIWSIAAAKLTAAMTLPLPETPEGALGRSARAPILGFLADADVLALGPGISRVAETGELVRALVDESPRATVVDADGLYHLAARRRGRVRAPGAPPLVLTPHPGEMARLADASSAAIQADRIGSAAAVARERRAVVVLKGHRTVVTDGDRVYVNDTGNPGLATGGSGDVLTGIVAALLGQRGLGLDPLEAAAIAVHVHGLAGDLAARSLGEISMTAEDLVEFLPAAFLSYAGVAKKPLRLRRSRP